MTFKIDGPIGQPQVFFNPLSAVAPGIFRKIFEFQRPYAVAGDSAVGGLHQHVLLAAVRQLDHAVGRRGRRQPTVAAGIGDALHR